MRQRPEVLDFFTSIDRSSNFMSVAEALIDAAGDADTGPAVQRAYAAVKERLKDEKRPVLSAEQARVYDRIRRSGVKAVSVDGGKPDFVEHLIVAVYARATTALMTHGTRAILSDLPNALAKVKPGLDQLPDDLFGEIIVESELRASRDGHFAQNLRAMTEEVRQTSGQIEPHKAEWQRALNDNPEDECDCVATGCNESGHCESFCLGFWDCLLLIFGIILIIILL